MRRRPLRHLLVTFVLASAVAPVLAVAAPTPAAAACASSFTKQLGGTVQGEDGRYVSAQVGIELLDSSGRKLAMDGCPMTAGGYSRSVSLNTRNGCCYILPGSGSTSSTYNGYQLTKSWSLTGIPSNAATAWIEVYPKRSGDSPNTDDSRYGRALRRPLPLSKTDVHVRLPLRCGLSENGVTGQTGSIRGRVYDNGALVQASRVGAWSTDADSASRILGWSLDIPATTTFDVEPLAPGTYSVIASANGLSKQLYNVVVRPCQVTNLNVAVRGTAPPVQPVDRPVAGDWDGDGDDEPGTFTPGGTWRLRAGAAPAESTATSFTYGSAAGDRPVVGDWDGDGKDDVGVFRAGGAWYLRSSVTGSTASIVQFGKAAGDRPVVGDWDGDGDDDLGVYRSGGTWVLRAPSGGILRSFTFGTSAGDTPVVGDWNGDGDDEPAIFRRGGTWYLRSTSAVSSSQLPSFRYGIQSTDLPVAGDWTGDGSSAPAIYRFGSWLLRAGTAPGDGIATTLTFGA